MNLSLIPTLFLFFGLLSLVFSRAIHFWLRQKDPLVVDHWSLGAFVWGIATILTVFRTELPLAISYFLANAIAFMANVEINRGLRALGRIAPMSPVNRVRDLWALLVYFCILYSIEYLAPADLREVCKTLFVSGAMVVLSILAARYCFLVNERYAIKLAWRLGHLFGVVAALWSARMLMALLGAGAYAFDATLINTVVFIGIFITGVLRYLTYPLLLVQKSENEQQQLLKTKVAQLNKAVTAGALSASMAHELNQPLASMRVNGQVLLRMLDQAKGQSGPELQADIHDILQDILSENDRAARTVSSLRSLFGQKDQVTASFDVSKQIQKNVALIRRELDKNQIALELELTPSLLVHLPEGDFDLVITNLLLNSMQALQSVANAQPKTIRVASKRTGDQVEVSISDNGPGVPKGLEDTLFSILSTHKDNGMGVGLWLSKYTLERHHGNLAYQAAHSEGAKFVVTLPLATPLS